MPVTRSISAADVAGFHKGHPGHKGHERHHTPTQTEIAARAAHKHDGNQQRITRGKG